MEDAEEEGGGWRREATPRKERRASEVEEQREAPLGLRFSSEVIWKSGLVAEDMLPGLEVGEEKEEEVGEIWKRKGVGLMLEDLVFDKSFDNLWDLVSVNNITQI